jgi:hypothetical protein
MNIQELAEKVEKYDAFIGILQQVVGSLSLPAAEVVAVLRAGLATLASGDTHENVMDRLAKLTSGEAADDAAAAAELATRDPIPTVSE